MPGRTGSARPFRVWGCFLAMVVGCLAGFMMFWGGHQKKEGEIAVADAELLHQAAVSSPSEEQPEVGSGHSDRQDIQENAVQSLLAEADQAFNDKRSKKSDFGLALNIYRKVLAIQPDNADARGGMLRIAEHYGAFAEQAMKANNFSEAGGYIAKGLSVTPGNGRLLALQSKLSEQRRDAIRKLADKAEEALQKKQLTTPADDCAYKYYLNILHIDGKNSLAMKGINRIADRYAELAEEAYRNLNIDKSKEYVRQGLAVAPQHQQLLQLQRDLTRSKPGMFFKSLEKSFKPLFQ
jgi:tetratricopeptide (TPR) repeat protein